MFDTTFSIIENEEQRNELAEFYSKHKNRLYSIAMSKLHNEIDAEDAVQEVFSKIADKPQNFFSVPSESRLVYADVIVRNVAIDMFNNKYQVPIEPYKEDESEDISVSLDNSLFDEISRREILAFICKLPELQKNVLILNCIHGLSIDETARKLDISLTVATKRLTLARRAIRAFIDERCKNNE